MGKPSRKQRRRRERSQKRYRARKARAKQQAEQRRAANAQTFTRFLRHFAEHEIRMQAFEPQLRRAILMTYRWCEDNHRRRPPVLNLCIDYALRPSR